MALRAAGLGDVEYGRGHGRRWRRRRFREHGRAGDMGGSLFRISLADFAVAKTMARQAGWGRQRLNVMPTTGIRHAARRWRALVGALIYTGALGVVYNFIYKLEIYYYTAYRVAIFNIPN